MNGWDNLIATYALRPSGGAQGGGSSGGAVDAGYVVEGLVQRGLPKHVAEGFAMNFADESGFDPGINERKPTVAGSRGGFGLYQLTGPRRRAYEAFAAERGVDVANPDAQMDFLVNELQTTERGAAKAIMQTESPGEAGAAIVNTFLRPAKEHRQRRAAKYLGGSGMPAPAKAPSYNRLWLDLVENANG